MIIAPLAFALWRCSSLGCHCSFCSYFGGYFLYGSYFQQLFIFRSSMTVPFWWLFQELLLFEDWFNKHLHLTIASASISLWQLIRLPFHRGFSSSFAMLVGSSNLAIILLLTSRFVCNYITCSLAFFREYLSSANLLKHLIRGSNPHPVATFTIVSFAVLATCFASTRCVCWSRSWVLIRRQAIIAWTLYVIRN